MQAAGKTEGRRMRPGPGRSVRLRVQRSPGPGVPMIQLPFATAAIAAGTVALAEIGDKTQLLALLLAARFRRPLQIIAGILAATLVNHAIAGLVGAWITSVIG